MQKLTEWLQGYGTDEVECVIPDFTGCARGKIMPAAKFILDQGTRLPESIFVQGVTGDYIDDDIYADLASMADGDILLKPDNNAVFPIPWAIDPTAMVIHDCFTKNGEPVTRSPRNVLRKVLQMYEQRGWQAVVAPELEFYLTKPCANADFPLEPPVGRSGRQEVGGRAYSIDAANEFDPMFEDVYAWCEIQGLDIDTLTHEEGTAQMEINFRHGDPLMLADQVFVFKRTVKEAALKHNITATFMAKPVSNEPGSSMHIHQSILDRKTGENIFTADDGSATDAFYHFIGGQQHYIAEFLPLFAPNVNSYRRFLPYTSAPVNLAWGIDNRTAGLRIPDSAPDARRVENRLAGADANVYLAMAGSLLAGLMGMEKKLQPTAPITGSAYDLEKQSEIPQNLEHALERMSESATLKEALGELFVRSYVEVKKAEYQNFKRVISSWERQHLLTTV